MPPGYSPPPKKVSHADLEKHRAERVRKAALAGIGAAAVLALGSAGAVLVNRRGPAKPSVARALIQHEVETPAALVIPPPTGPSPLPLPGVLGDPVAPEQRVEYLCVAMESAGESKKAQSQKPRLKPAGPIYRVDAFERPLPPPGAPLETPDPRTLFADMPIGVLCGQGQDPRGGFTLETPLSGCIQEDGPRLKPLGSCGDMSLLLFTISESAVHCNSLARFIGSVCRSHIFAL